MESYRIVSNRIESNRIESNYSSLQVLFHHFQIVVECSSDNGSCSFSESCRLIDLKFVSVSRCVCKEGVYRSSVWDSCDKGGSFKRSLKFKTKHSTCYQITRKIFLIGSLYASFQSCLFLNYINYIHL